MDQDLQAIILATSEFLHYRFGQPSANDYVQWRRGRGERLKNISELRGLWLIDADYEAVFKEPYPCDDRIMEVFERFWHAGTDLIPGSTITEIAADPVGVCVRAVRMGPGDPWPLLECELTSELWHGYVVNNKRNWWQGPTDANELRRRHAFLDVIVLGLVVRMDNGDRVPWHFTWHKDPSAKIWVLHSVTTGNVLDSGSSLEF